LRRRAKSPINFLISDTFTDSLARLTGDEQKAVKTTAIDLQMDPSGAGMSFHKLDRAKDKNFWSVRVSRDIRLIIHKTTGSLLALAERLPAEATEALLELATGGKPRVAKSPAPLQPPSSWMIWRRFPDLIGDLWKFFVSRSPMESAYARMKNIGAAKCLRKVSTVPTR
jgi:mRNA-degrading endonuclease RelE of RelBE toxin-antitoxin system